MERDYSIDALKGCGIILMIVGHSLLPSLWARPFLTFHMPLFFIVSGYLFKERPLNDLIKRNLKKVMIPYFFTGCVMWFLLAILYEQYDWGISLLWGNAYKTLFWDFSYTVGPLWFLMSFFVAMIFFALIKKIPHRWLQLVILITLFHISIWIKEQVNMLPLGILPAIPGTFFLFLGNSLKESKSFVYNRGSILLGFICYILCCLYGQLAMSWHIYKLLLLQIIAAMFATLILWKIIRMMGKFIFLSYVGFYSLPIMCIHSIDRHLKLTLDVVHKLNISYLPINVGLDILFKALFVAVVFLLIKRISVFKLIYSIK